MRISYCVSLSVFGVFIGIGGIAAEKSTCPRELGAGNAMYGNVAEIRAAKAQILKTSHQYARLADFLEVAKRTEPEEIKILSDSQSPQRRGGIVSLLRADVDFYKRHVEGLLNLFRIIRNQSNQHESEIQRIETLVNDFAAKLPSSLEIDRVQNFNMADRIGPLEVMHPSVFRDNLETKFGALQDEMALGDLIRDLRKLGTLNSPEVRKALQVQVNSGIEKMLAMDAEFTNNSLGYSASASVSIYKLIGNTLPNNAGIKTQLAANSARPLILGSYNLLAHLFMDILRNANDASIRTVPKGTLPTYEGLSKTSIQKKSDGSVQIQIEDSGNPEEFLSSHTLGDSIANKMGIGRYKVQLVAAILDFEVTHRAKSNGSGSIVTVTIPAQYVQEFEN